MSKSTQTNKSQVVETVNVFNDGITTNRRNSWGCSLSKQFIKFPDRLQLRPGLIEHTGADDMYAMVNYSNDIYGLGEEGVHRGIMFKSSFASFSTWSYEDAADFDNDSWLFAFKDYLFYYDTSYKLNHYGNITATASETLDYHTFNRSTKTTFELIQPFIHPTDGYAYFWDKNNAYQLRSAPGATSAGDTTWTKASIDIPAHLSISAACSYGEYIAIFAYDNDIDRTYLYIWDRSLTLEDFISVREWGDGEVIYAATLNGTLFGISKISRSFPGEPDTLNVAFYSGGIIERIERSSLDLNDGVVLGGFSTHSYATATNTHLYFTGVEVGLGGAERSNVVWSLDYLGNLDIPITLGDVVTLVRAFVVESDTFLIAPGSSTYGPITDAVKVNYLTFEGEYTLLDMDGNIPHKLKQPKVFTVSHSPILTGGSVKIEVYSQADDTWTTLKTNSTAGEMRTSVNNIKVQTFSNLFRVTVNKVEFIYQMRVVSDILETDIA